MKLAEILDILCISEARTRSSNQHTIQIEGTGLIVSVVQKTFDWHSKIIDKTGARGVCRCPRRIQLLHRNAALACPGTERGTGLGCSSA